MLLTEIKEIETQLALGTISPHDVADYLWKVDKKFLKWACRSKYRIICRTAKDVYFHRYKKLKIIRLIGICNVFGILGGVYITPYLFLLCLSLFGAFFVD